MKAIEVLSRPPGLRAGGSSRAGHPQRWALGLPLVDRADDRRLRPDEFLPRHRHPRVVRHDGPGGNLRHAAGQRHRHPDVADRIGGAAATIFVGSGANDVVAPIIPLVTRNTIANDALNAAPLIGRVLGDRSDVLPPEQVYRGGLPVSASGGVSTEASGQRSGPNPDERPVDPLPIRLRSRPHRLASAPRGLPSGRTRIGRRDPPGTPSALRIARVVDRRCVGRRVRSTRGLRRGEGENKTGAR